MWILTMFCPIRQKVILKPKNEMLYCIEYNKMLTPCKSVVVDYSNEVDNVRWTTKEWEPDNIVVSRPEYAQVQNNTIL